ncbi:hypothetical protein KI387_042123, partial [Taxus chinensis]
MTSGRSYHFLGINCRLYNFSTDFSAVWASFYWAVWLHKPPAGRTTSADCISGRTGRGEAINQTVPSSLSSCTAAVCDFRVWGNRGHKPVVIHVWILGMPPEDLIVDGGLGVNGFSKETRQKL